MIYQELQELILEMVIILIKKTITTIIIINNTILPIINRKITKKEHILRIIRVVEVIKFIIHLLQKRIKIVLNFYSYDSENSGNNSGYNKKKIYNNNSNFVVNEFEKAKSNDELTIKNTNKEYEIKPTITKTNNANGIY
jgi:hypothetical protein